MSPRLLAVCFVLLAAVAAWQVGVIPEPLMQQAVGPVVFPTAVVIALSVLALLYALSAWRGRQVDLSHEADQSPLPGASVRAVAMLGGGLAFMLLVEPLGFVLPATLCGMGVARSFDAPLGLKSALICGAISVLFWTLFAQVLGVGLGPALPWLI